MESVTYKNSESEAVAPELFSVRRKTPILARKSLIPCATTLRVVVDGSKGPANWQLVSPQ